MTPSTQKTIRQQLHEEFMGYIAQGEASINRLDAALQRNSTVSNRLETTNERFYDWREQA